MPALCDVTFEELVTAVADEIAAGKVGRLVHVRLHAALPEEANELPVRAEAMAQRLSRWFASKLVSLHWQEAISPIHGSLLGRFGDGETLLLSCTVRQETAIARFDLLAIGTQGTIRLEETGG